MKKILLLLLLMTACTQTYTINIYKDMGSSGADRFYNVTLTFKDDELIKGNSRYDYWSGSDGSHTISKCKYINNNWEKIGNSTTCSVSIVTDNQTTNIPDTRANIQKYIQTGQYKPAKTCKTGEICYKVL